MKLLRSIILGVFLITIASHLADCLSAGVSFRESAPGAGPSVGGSSEAARDGAITSINISTAVKRVLKILRAPLALIRKPLSIITAPLQLMFNLLIKQPLSLAAKGLSLVLNLIKGLGGINAQVLDKIVAQITPLINQIMDVLVDIGVFQGKTFEDILNTINDFLTAIINWVIGQSTDINTYANSFIKTLISELKIKETIKRVLSLPIVKELADFIKTIYDYIKDNFQAQIDEFKAMIKGQIEAHKDFFQPIFDGISSRILIISNAVKAFINGNLGACAGEVQINGTPTDKLIWQVHEWIYDAELRIATFLGFTDEAVEAQAKLNELAMSTIMPPIAAITPAPQESTTTPLPMLPPEGSEATQPSPPEEPQTATPPQTTTPSEPSPQTTEGFSSSPGSQTTVASQEPTTASALESQTTESTEKSTTAQPVPETTTSQTVPDTTMSQLVPEITTSQAVPGTTTSQPVT